MTRIDFYFNAPDKADVARRLVAKAYAAGLNTLIYTADPALAGELDTTLWTRGPVDYTRRNATAGYMAGIAVDSVLAAIRERLSRAHG